MMPKQMIKLRKCHKTVHEHNMHYTTNVAKRHKKIITNKPNSTSYVIF